MNQLLLENHNRIITRLILILDERGFERKMMKIIKLILKKDSFSFN